MNSRRRDPIMIVQAAGNGHIGGDYSDRSTFWSAWYYTKLNLDPAEPLMPERDRLILSKGHTAGALYITLAAVRLRPRGAR
ncbi:MAG: hypothetical protein QM804_02520 [Propionicimonas sp.]